ncbi:MOSC domain-containing protein [Parasalinivibrio latis]|uniref:MOSC domain-containing protein n=1 Tax=Parasalinivibrio latis TaxID=2952610 RepID=UPI0030E1329F
MKKVRPTGVFTGKVSEEFGFPSAMGKSLISGRIYLSETGLEGDEVASTQHHGGPERALHQYPSEHYTYWREHFGADAGWGIPGMGENLSTEGMTEENVCIGDRFQWGEAVIEVSQPRSPCYKLNRRWGIENFSVTMQEISRCGWLYRVITPGYVSADDELVLVAREDNAMTIKAVCDSYFGDPLNPERLHTLREQTKLSASWKEKVEKRLETGEVENWNFRLLGHA